MEAGAKELLVCLVESLSAPLSLHDGDGKALYQNAAHLRLFGDCTGHLCSQLVHNSSQGCHPCTLESEGECVGEAILTDGRKVLVRAARLPNDEGHVLEVLQVFSQQPEYEAVESFVHTAAHDLKTPLVSIKGYAELLQRELNVSMESERGRVFSERILQQAQRMEGLLDELLAFSRADTSGGEVRDLDLGVAARTAWGGLLDLVESVGGQLELAPELPRVRLSPVRLQQVLTNLFTNAIRYRNPGRPLRVLVRPYELDCGSAHVACVAVEDNGVGLRAGDEERIFRLFHRGRRAGEENSEGSGIGLAIVKRIVDGAGGKVWAEQGEEEGTRFMVCLPTAQELS